MPDIDPAFLALPARELAGAALERATQLGCEHADFRLERTRTAMLSLRDARLDSTSDREDVGLAVRVVHDGAWGFASGIVRTASAARQLADQAVATAKVSRVLSSTPVQLAAEPVYDDVTWVSAYDVNPFDISESDRLSRLTELSERLLAADGVDHVDARVEMVLENKFYADSHGTTTTQQRVRVAPRFTAVHVDRAAGSFSSMRTLAPAAGRGWEYLTGTGWDFDAEIDELPELLSAQVKAPSVEAGR
ncbi:MAG TPA: DNA gyrase modulator, partial [Jatrophihabitans sp.]